RFQSLDIRRQAGLGRELNGGKRGRKRQYQGDLQTNFSMRGFHDLSPFLKSKMLDTEYASFEECATQSRYWLRSRWLTHTPEIRIGNIERWPDDRPKWIPLKCPRRANDAW